MLSAREIEHAIENFRRDVSYSYTTWKGVEISGTYLEEGWHGFFNLMGREGIELEGVGKAYRVDDVGGEGEGDYMHVVFELIDEDGTARLFKKEGRWVSFEGSDWEDGDFYEAVPAQKTITVYERKRA